MIDFRLLAIGDIPQKGEPYGIAVETGGVVREWAKLQVRHVLPGPHLLGDPAQYKWSEWVDVPFVREEG